MTLGCVKVTALTRTPARATERLWNQLHGEKLGHVGQALEEGIKTLSLPVCGTQAPGDTPKTVMKKPYNENLLEKNGPNGETLKASLMAAPKTNKESRFPGVVEIFRDCQFRHGAWEIICNRYLESKTNERRWSKY